MIGRTSDKSRLAFAIALALVAALLALPSISDAGNGKKLVDKDVGKGKSPVAVAQATIKNPKKMSLVVSSKPRNKKVEWTYTSDCFKNGEVHRFPPPGEHITKVGTSKIRSKIKTAVGGADSCRVAVSGKLDFKSGKKVVAKIFHRR